MYFPKELSRLPFDADYVDDYSYTFRVLQFNYVDHICTVYEDKYEGYIYVKSGTAVKRLTTNENFLKTVPWLESARRQFCSSRGRTSRHLMFDSRNRAATFLYGNSVRATTAFSDVLDDKNTVEFESSGFEEEVKSVNAFNVDKSVKNNRRKRRSSKGMGSDASYNEYAALTAGAKELENRLQMSMMKTAVSDALDEFVEGLGGNNDASMWVRPYRDSFSELKKSDNFEIWNESQFNCIKKDLERTGVILNGRAGTGKGYIAQNIGNYLDGYDKVLYAKLSTGRISPCEVAYGEKVSGKYTLGIILEGALLAQSVADEKTAVVVQLDEITRSDFAGDISVLFDFLSHKGESSISLPEFGDIVYPKNLFLICTANEGVSYNAVSITDKAFNERFISHKIVGVLESRETLDKFKSTCKNERLKEILEEIFKELEDASDGIDRSISTRVLSWYKDGYDDVTIDDLMLSANMKKLIEG